MFEESGANAQTKEAGLGVTGVGKKWEVAAQTPVVHSKKKDKERMARSTPIGLFKTK